MAVFAAMVDRLDQNIGRILQKLDKEGIAENTIVIFLSDNGSCPYDSNRDFIYPPGDSRGFRTLSASWANVGNTPFRYFKQYGHEGGCITHCIVRWPQIIEPNKITNQIGHIADIYPTILDIADINYPLSVDKEKTIPLYGQSLLSIIKGNNHLRSRAFLSGSKDAFRMYRDRKWKIVKLNGEEWELYDMENDPTELTDLSEVYPNIRNEILQKYLNEKQQLESNLSP